MSVTRIIGGLERIRATGTEARIAARLGFLEWAFASGEATPQAAISALSDPAAQNPRSDAAQVFVGYLKQATQAGFTPTRRRRRLRLH